MTNFLDWLTLGDSGFAADRLKEQNRLSQDEMQRATQALAPAFMLALQRLATDVPAWTGLMREFGALGPGGGAPSFDAFGAPGASKLMNAFFGSDALSKAVARQASTMSGIAPDVVLKMMPSFSLLTVQAMLRMANPALFDPKALPTDPAGTTMAEVLRRSANAVEAFSQPSNAAPGRRAGGAAPFGMESLFADALRGGFPWMNWPTPTQAQPAGGETPPNPLDPFQAMGPLLAAFSQGLDATPKGDATPPRSGPTKPAKAATPAGKGDVFAEMMGTGQAMHAEYAREMMALFDRHRPKSS